MSPLTFGFVRGLSLPIYLLIGIAEGIRAGWREYESDTAILRSLWTTDGEPE